MDHQHGLVIRFAINKGVDIWFDVTNTKPTDKAILSDKDTKHPQLKDFDSPFNVA